MNTSLTLGLRDFFKASPAGILVDAVRTGRPAPSADDRLRATILATLAELPAWLPDVSNVWVDDGIAVLQGVYANDAARLATRDAVARVAGVAGVRDDRVRAREWQALA